ncbi:MAG: DNA/RNA non-specific endonuclease [Bacteroidetes bacterium]|nr:DNA/RNA non-specific endonuclease [Bacteroidota bacterium]
MNIHPKFLLKYLFLAFFLITSNAYSQVNNQENINKLQSEIDSVSFYKNQLIDQMEELKLGQIRYELMEKGLPKLQPGEELIMHSAMALVYDEKHKNAKWVAHIITYDIVEGNVVRSNDFRTDSKVKSGTAVEADYFIREKQADGTYKFDGFGYDRGHLAPSADFRWSEKALSESYYYSNITPQTADFNRISWASLEDMFRAYVQRNENSRLFIITAPVLKDNLPRIERGVNKVSIPEYHYKIAVDLEREMGIAFLMPNKLAENPIEYYAVSIDYLEELTGIDFFYKLPAELQAKIESQKNPLPWMSPAEQGDALPIAMNLLPRNHFNTTQAKRLVNNPKRVSICGTVVSARKSGRGNVFLNLDKSFPNQVFTVTIFKDNVVNFSYEPHVILINQQICVSGNVTEYSGTPNMILTNEHAIELFVVE